MFGAVMAPFQGRCPPSLESRKKKPLSKYKKIIDLRAWNGIIHATLTIAVLYLKGKVEF
jgi:hypothetical protein